MNKFDIVIIGSGLGGLLSAAILSKYGYSVCVLEKNPVIGGNLQTFVRKNCRFNSGMHYLGSLDKGQILYRIFNFLEIYDKITFEKFNTQCFDKIIIDNQEYDLATGIENYTNNLIKHFPEEENQIKNYIDKIQQVWNNNPILNFRDINNDEYYNSNYQSESLIDVINSIIDNEKLKSVLLANNGLYAGNPSETPFYIHALISYFFIQSAYRIKGGSHILAEAIKQIIEKNNGIVLTNKEVCKINILENKAISVTNTDKTNIFANIFISNIHPSVTNKLIEKGALKNAYVNRIASLKNSVGAFMLFIVLKKKHFKYINSNIYFSKSDDIWAAVYNNIDEWPKGYMLYTTKDEKNPEYAESATIITFMNYEEVVKWENTSIGNRGEDYLKFKDTKTKQILKTVNIKYPEFDNCIDSIYSASPLTFRDYTATPEGSMYGIIKNCNDAINTHVPITTKIKNLFLTGQNVGIHGILGVTINAIIACSNIIGINKIINDIKETQ
jgi:all-trans-retinol 13,14-reductase